MITYSAWWVNYFCFLTKCFIVSGVECVSPQEIEQHLTMGMQLLARAQYGDALSHFHAAVGKYLRNLIAFQTSHTIKGVETTLHTIFN